MLTGLRTEREKFVSGPHRDAWEKLVQAAAFEEALRTAILVMTEEEPQHFANPESSWQAGVRIAGARKALEILCTLHQKTEPRKQTKLRDLHYEAGV